MVINYCQALRVASEQYPKALNNVTMLLITAFIDLPRLSGLKDVNLGGVELSLTSDSVVYNKQA